MRSLLIIVLLFFCLPAQSQTFEIICEGIYSPVDTIELSSFQSSFDFTYYYTEPNAGLDGGIYVLQFITLSENSVFDTLIINPTEDQNQLISYVYPKQKYNVDVIYNTEIIPRNYLAIATYNILVGTSADTCRINFVLKFEE